MPDNKTTMLNSEILTMIGIGGTLAGLLLGMWSQLSTSITTLNSDIRDLRNDTGELRERMANLEGRLDGVSQNVAAIRGFGALSDPAVAASTLTPEQLGQLLQEWATINESGATE